MTSTAVSAFGAGLISPVLSSGVRVVDAEIRCDGVYRDRRCGRKLAEFAARPHCHTCSRCGHRNERP